MSLRAALSGNDHKAVGLRYLLASLGFLLLGGGLALLVRWQCAFPKTGLLSAQAYNGAFTMHATVMVFLVVMPLLLGGLGNYIVPLQVGARGTAFPGLGATAWWLYLASGAVWIASFFAPGGAAATGWTAYAPLSTFGRFNQSFSGQTLWCVALGINSVGSMLTAANLAVTVVMRRARGMRLFRMPVFVWSVFVTCFLVLIAVPVLVAADAMLLLDLVAGTAFFDVTRGGQPLLWQHLFWFFGHPEVYILILPAMGVVSEVLPVFSRRPLFGYAAMVWAMVAIGVLGFVVWGHHMFVSGMSLLLSAAFSLSTYLIAVPSSVKTFNWLGTLWRGSIRFELPLCHAAAFVSMFVVGGLSGIFMASTPVDLFIHNTYFIVAHIHYVLFGGSLFGVFAAVAYWFPKITGRKLGDGLGQAHFWLTLLFFNLTFFPMHTLGLGGMMRRIPDPTLYEHLRSLQPINQFSALAAMGLGLAQLLFFWNLWRSARHGEPAGENPWHAATLEWTCPSPPPPGNFSVPPVVHRGPYEYGEHGEGPENSDFSSQDKPL
ncbi:MAG TPA: cbb3-type cytochrome c oxidase subunit I [Candidatus Methylacidiphilales bacterium]